MAHPCGAIRKGCNQGLHPRGADCDQVGSKGHRGSPCGNQVATGDATRDDRGRERQLRCRLHGGNTTNSKRRRVRDLSAMALKRLGVAVDIDPQGALLQMVREAWGNVIFLRERARALGTELIGDVLDAARDGSSYHIYATSEEVRAIVKLYGEWTDRLVKYSKAAIDAGIDTARLELEREAVDVLFAAVTAGLDAAGVTPAQRARALQATVDQLRKVEPREPVGAERN